MEWARDEQALALAISKVPLSRGLDCVDDIIVDLRNMTL